jgi:dihydroneopterin aldolase
MRTPKRELSRPAGAGQGAPDQLLLQGMVFFGHHGHLVAERKLGGKITVDLRVQTSVDAAAKTDRLDRTVDYVRVHAVVKGVVEGRRFALLETLADAIARAVLRLPGVEGVTVRVGKHPPLPEHFETFAVEIERRLPPRVQPGRQRER